MLTAPILNRGMRQSKALRLRMVRRQRRELLLNREKQKNKAPLHKGQLRMVTLNRVTQRRAREQHKVLEQELLLVSLPDERPAVPCEPCDQQQRRLPPQRRPCRKEEYCGCSFRFESIHSKQRTQANSSEASREGCRKP